MSYVVCAPVKLIPGAPPYPNTHYEQVACPMCSELMYLGPRGKAQAARGTPMLCMICAVEHRHKLGISPAALLHPTSLGGP